MIKGIHVTYLTPKAEELRAFFRDKLGLPDHDVGEGWLLFPVPEADIGCHPWESALSEVSFYCDNIHETVSQLKERGVEFVSDIKDEGWGFTVTFRMPGDFDAMLYQPKYEK